MAASLFTMTALFGLTYQRYSSPFAECQAGLASFNTHGGRVTSLNHMGAVKHLMSMLRDKKTDTAQFRHYSDRIMRLLIEEALAQELKVETRVSPTGDSYAHYAPAHAVEDFAAVTIMRGGDSMLTEVFNLLPGVANPAPKATFRPPTTIPRGWRTEKRTEPLQSSHP